MHYHVQLCIHTYFCHAFLCSSIIMKKNSLSPKTKYKNCRLPDPFFCLLEFNFHLQNPEVGIQYFKSTDDNGTLKVPTITVLGTGLGTFLNLVLKIVKYRYSFLTKKFFFF